MHLSLYWAEECRWDHAQSTVPHRMSKSAAVYRIDVPCGVERCPGLMRILAVMHTGSRVEDATDIVKGIHLTGMLCDNQHPNYGLAAHRAILCTAISVNLKGEPMEWAT
jgi:hypothetical protein